MSTLAPQIRKEFSSLKEFYSMICDLYFEFRPRVLQEPNMNTSFKVLARSVRGRKWIHFWIHFQCNLFFQFLSAQSHSFLRGPVSGNVALWRMHINKVTASNLSSRNPHFVIMWPTISNHDSVVNLNRMVHPLQLLCPSYWEGGNYFGSPHLWFSFIFWRELLLRCSAHLQALQSAY